jgi:type III secretion protein Q
MNVRPFARALFPQVTAREARATRAALSIITGLPTRWTWEIPPLGVACSTIMGVGHAAAEIGPGGLAIVLVAGTHTGRLLFDAAFASRLVDAALRGRGTRSTPRRLGPGERGVVVGLLGRAFSIAGWTVRLGSAPPLLGAGSITLAVGMELAAAGTSVVRVELPECAAVSSQAADEQRRVRAGRLPVVARIELAGTSLSASDIAALCVGDAVVFEGMSPLVLSAESWDARLAVGDGVTQAAAPLRVSASGVGILQDGFVRARPDVREEGKMDATKATILAETPIEVIAEMGRIALRGDELMGLAPGAVLTIGARPRQVTLRVAGEAWAEGEIVDVEGELGVRVLRLLPR